MSNDDRRISDVKNWEDVRLFIMESREYRATDRITQKFVAENVAALAEQVKIQNGRVAELERFKNEINVKIQDKKVNNANILTFITICLAVVMAVSAVVMLFKK